MKVVKHDISILERGGVQAPLPKF